MATSAREALSAAVTKEDVLKLIPQFEIHPLFLRQHLDREIVIGMIGDRGGGKSGSDAVISLVDFMFAGKPVVSNMKIKADIEIDDTTAQKYGLNSGGIAHYESEDLEKDALLKLDERYMNHCLTIEEINVQYSNVRRFMSNTNVDFNEVCQQLRKLKASLLYNVIDEMFVDPQLRTLTDIFVRTYDTAFDLDALERRKQTGLDFHWKIYPMSAYLAGEQGKYSITHKALPPVYLHFAPWRGIYDSLKHQEKGIYSMSSKDKKAMIKGQISVESSTEIVEETNKWAWLEDNVRKLKNAGLEFLEASQLWQVLEITQHGYVPQVIGKILPSFGITRHHQNRFGQWVFRIETFSLPGIGTHTNAVSSA